MMVYFSIVANAISILLTCLLFNQCSNPSPPLTLANLLLSWKRDQFSFHWRKVIYNLGLYQFRNRSSKKEDFYMQNIFK